MIYLWFDVNIFFIFDNNWLNYRQEHVWLLVIYLNHSSYKFLVLPLVSVIYFIYWWQIGVSNLQARIIQIYRHFINQMTLLQVEASSPSIQSNSVISKTAPRIIQDTPLIHKTVHIWILLKSSAVLREPCSASWSLTEWLFISVRFSLLTLLPRCSQSPY